MNSSPLNYFHDFISRQKLGEMLVYALMPWLYLSFFVTTITSKIFDICKNLDRNKTNFRHCIQCIQIFNKLSFVFVCIQGYYPCKLWVGCGAIPSGPTPDCKPLAPTIRCLLPSYFSPFSKWAIAKTLILSIEISMCFLVVMKICVICDTWPWFQVFRMSPF